MRPAVRQTRSFLMKLFKERGINPRGDLGQNFLIDLNLLLFVVDNAEINSNDVVLEVGSGTGGMTTFIAQKAAHVVSVEYDNNMYEMATKHVAAFSNVTLLHCDALKNKNRFAPQVMEELEKHLKAGPNRSLKLVANLPYNIGTAVMSNLVASDLPWKRMVVTIQLELGIKMKARASSDDYGALSVWLQSQTHIRFLKKLPPTVFWPRPKVNSAIMLVVPKPEEKIHILNRAFFQDFVRTLFTQRRKQLRTTLASMYKKQFSKTQIDQLCQEVGLDQNARAENMTPESHVTLANHFYRTLNPQMKYDEKPTSTSNTTAVEELTSLVPDVEINELELYIPVVETEDQETPE